MFDSSEDKMETENLTVEFRQGIPDYKFQYTYVPIAITSFLFCFIMALFVCPVLSWHFIKTYRTCTRYQQFDWNSRVVSDVHAIIVTTLGMYGILFDKPTWEDKVWGESYLPRAAFAITTGYIASDTCLILIGFPWSESISIALHHLAVVVAYGSNIVYGPLTFFGNFRIISEMSTPFVNLRWMLYLCGYKDSKLYLYNGFAMLGTFFLVRLCIIPPFYYFLIGTFIYEFTRAPVWMWVFCFGSCISLDVINIFWFRRMFKGACRMLKKRAEQSEENTRTRIKGE